MGEYSGAAIVAAVVSFVFQMLKRSPVFPWVSAQTARLNTWVAIVLAVVAAAGVHVTFAGDVLTVSGLSWDALYQYGVQQVFYLVIVKRFAR